MDRRSVLKAGVAAGGLPAPAFSQPFVPNGFYRACQARRSNLSGIAPGPLPWFWGVSKS